jgi:uncharacterized glyoxalase superfamily protein PhnB
MADNYPAVIPMIAYEDGIAAIDWLSQAFGFQEREQSRHLWPDGKLSHAEMLAGDGLIMLATPTPDYQCPKRHREHCDAASRWSEAPWIIDGVLVYVDDVAAHFAQAKARRGEDALGDRGRAAREALSGGGS